MIHILMELLAFWLILAVFIALFDTVLRPLLGNLPISSKVADVAVLALVLASVVYVARHVGYFDYFVR